MIKIKKPGFRPLVFAGVALLILTIAVAAIAAKKDVPTIKLGLLASHEYYVPFLIADQNGYYDDLGVNVEIKTFMSAQERDTAFQTEKVDGVITDIIGSALIREFGLDVWIAGMVAGVTADDELFYIVAGPKSKVKSVKDLAGKKVALSQNTIIEYVVYQILEQNGMKPSDIVKVSVPKIPIRYQMLMDGQVDAAGMPQLMATLAVSQGARIVADDSRENISQTVLTVSGKTLKEKGKALTELMRGYNRGVKELNGKPAKYRELFLNTTGVPDDIRKEYKIPELSYISPLEKTPFDRAMKWIAAKNLVKKSYIFKDMVNNSLIPNSKD